METSEGDPAGPAGGSRRISGKPWWDKLIFIESGQSKKENVIPCDRRIKASTQQDQERILANPPQNHRRLLRRDQDLGVVPPGSPRILRHPSRRDKRIARISKESIKNPSRIWMEQTWRPTAGVSSLRIPPLRGARPRGRMKRACCCCSSSSSSSTSSWASLMASLGGGVYRMNVPSLDRKVNDDASSVSVLRALRTLPTPVLWWCCLSSDGAVDRDRRPEKVPL